MPESRILYTPRQSKPKRKKFSREQLRLALAIAGVIVFFGLCIGVTRLQYFRIQDIRIGEIAGTAGMIGTERDVEELNTAIENLLGGNYAFVIPRRFILSIGSRSLERRLLAALPRFEIIGVDKRFPRGLSVSYVKRAFFALLCTDPAKTGVRSCGYIDRTGFMYEDAPEASGSLILRITTDLQEIKVGANAVNETTVRQMAGFGDGIKGIPGLRLIAYELAGQAPDEIRIRIAPTGGGEFTLIAKKGDDAESVMRVLRTVLAEEVKDNVSKLDYMDLRLGNKVFFKYRK